MNGRSLIRCFFDVGLILILSTSCSNAQPDTQTAPFTTPEDTIQLKPHAEYISEETRLYQRIRQTDFRRDAVQDVRRFYALPQERGKTLSVGDTRDGFLIHGMAFPFPSTVARQLPVQYERGLIYGTPDLMTLLEDTAKKMHATYPETWMYLGNMGAREGGDIPYSVSHNAGRDADIAFYLLDEQGRFATPQNMYKIDKHLKSRGAEADYRFDVEKNATLLETLLMHETVAVQFIFVAKHLRRALYDELVRRERPQEVLDRFAQTVQNQSAHDDHFHVRIYCSDDDIRAGCMDRSTIHPWERDPEPVRTRAIENFRAILTDDNADFESQKVALQRLDLLGVARENADLILSFLPSPDAEVRATAAKTAKKLGGRAVDPLIQRLDGEDDVAVRVAILETLATLDGAQIQKTFIAKLPDASPEEQRVMTHYIEHHPTKEDLNALILAFEKSPQNRELIRAIEVVANRSFCETAEDDDACLEEIRAWQKKNGKKKRAQWILEGFQRAGYDVKRLDKSSIRALLDAIDGPRFVSFNAQLTLKDIAKMTQDSLDWSIDDARWHYTRYFKHHEKKYGVDLSDRNEKGVREAQENDKTP